MEHKSETKKGEGDHGDGSTDHFLAKTLVK